MRDFHISQIHCSFPVFFFLSFFNRSVEDTLRSLPKFKHYINFICLLSILCHLKLQILLILDNLSTECSLKDRFFMFWAIYNTIEKRVGKFLPIYSVIISVRYFNCKINIFTTRN